MCDTTTTTGLTVFYISRRTRRKNERLSLMKSLVMFSYKQPVEGSKFRWGVLNERRNTNEQPLSWATIDGSYRKNDPEFKRSRDLDTVQTRDGVKAFYRERQKWGIKIPFVGSLVSPYGVGRYALHC